jgi:uncharacterized protein
VRDDLNYLAILRAIFLCQKFRHVALVRMARRPRQSAAIIVAAKQEQALEPEQFITMMIVGACAAVVNAVAGGGPILTIGALSLFGVDPRIASLTSTVALSPGQLAAGWLGRDAMRVIRFAPPLLLLGLAVAGGGAGALMLLWTSSSAFGAIVPWLVLLATAVYVWSGIRQPAESHGKSKASVMLTALLVPLAVYGGYFGGGNSFLVLALLRIAGHDSKEAGAAKNALIAAVNFGAVAVFAFSGLVDWRAAAALASGGLVGSVVGARLLKKMQIAAISVLVVGFGLFFAGWMFAQ